MYHLQEQSAPEISISDAVKISLLLSIQASGEEVLPIVVLIPFVVSNLSLNAMHAISDRERGAGEHTPLIVPVQ